MARKTIRKPSKQFDVPFIDGPITVKPLSALRYGEIEERFPVDTETKTRKHAYAFFAAIMAATIVEPDGTPSFEETQLQAEFDADDFWDLWDVVGGYLGMREKEKKPAKDGEGPGKNSPSVNGSPSALPVS